MVCFWVNVYVGRHVPSGKVEVGSGVPYTFVPFCRHVVRVHANRSRPTCLWRITWLDTRFLEELSYFCDILAKKWNFSKVRWFFFFAMSKQICGPGFQILRENLFEKNISLRKVFCLIFTSYESHSQYLKHISVFKELGGRQRVKVIIFFVILIYYQLSGSKTLQKFRES